MKQTRNLAYYRRTLFFRKQLRNFFFKNNAMYEHQGPQHKEPY